jgi:hypothetical protein
VTQPPEPAPAVLGSAGVLSYALADAEVRYSGAICLYVGGQLLGRVPRLAIAQDPATSEILLLHCDEQWDVLGVSSGGPTLAAAKARAERGYPGIGAKWIDTPRSPEQIASLVRDSWEDQACSFCGRVPSEFTSSVQAPSARICNLCISDYYQWQSEDPSA